MAFAMIGEVHRAQRRRFHLGYTRPMYEWQKHAEAHLRRKVGCMDGLALHFWHGPKALHKYGSREKILVDTQFNLQTDLKRSAQGLSQLIVGSPRQRKLRHSLHAYFSQRSEDSIDL